MRHLRLSLACAGIAACSLGHAALSDDVIFIAGFTTEPPAVLDITSDHNVVRAAVGVAPLYWDERLAATAQAWAQSCTPADASNTQIGHNNDRSVGYPWYVGENIASSTGNITGTIAVNLWAAELQYYDYATNTCASGQVCGHYTQIVWADTYLVGCGVAFCPNLTYSHALVCDYGPGGNYLGQWPY